MIEKILIFVFSLFYTIICIRSFRKGNYSFIIKNLYHEIENSILAGCTALVVATSCTQRAVEKQTWVEKAIENAHAQIGLEIDTIESSGRFLNPVTLNNKGGVYYCGYADWRSGFFPGSVWYLYELTGDTALLPLAQKYTEAISEAQNLTWHHDIGFIINCSFGNGLRLIDKTRL